jgi:prefoldin alpha subunit
LSNQEYIMKLMSFEQESNKLEQQMQLIDQQIVELQTLHAGLEELDKTQEKTLLANLGKNIFIKTEITDKNLFVDVGNKTFVNKNIEETNQIVDRELDKLLDGKREVLERIDAIRQEMENIIAEVEKTRKE